MSTIKMIYIPAEEDAKPQILEVEQDQVYEKLQELVDGYFEAVQVSRYTPIAQHHTLYVNEEGIPRNLPVNKNAFTEHSFEIVRRNFALLFGNPPLGNMVLVGPPDEEGYDTSVSDEVLAHYAKYV